MTQNPQPAKTTPGQQRAAFTALLQSLGPATHEQVAAMLAEREPAADPLPPDIVEAMRARLAVVESTRDPSVKP